jgi:HD superfamily phosphohydrolase
LGSDRLDYLRRDAYYCGVSFGYVDYEQLLTNLEYSKGLILVRESGLSTVEMLFIARHLMFFTVYLHRTVRIADSMLKIALEEALKKNILKVDNLIWDGDNACLIKMSKYIPIARALLNRKLYKMVDKVGKNKNYILISQPKVHKKEEPILIKMRSGDIKPVNQLSPLISNLGKASKLRVKKFFAVEV